MSTDTIDITPITVTDADKLKELIWQAVKDTQSVIIQTLPDKLKMTKAQFLILDEQDEMRQFFTDTKERVWITPDNAMDIEVVE